MSANRTSAHSAGRSVIEFLETLDHPHKLGILRLRGLILAADSRIGESIKWNAPSFTLHDHFATFKLHPPTAIQLVLHVGAKPMVPVRQFNLDLLVSITRWAAPDRCVLTFQNAAQVEDLREDVVVVIRQWIAQCMR
jgi:hypothetical protein